MKILFLITSLDVGGAERQVLDLAERLTQKGHEVLIVYMTGRGALISPGMSITTLGLGCTKSGLSFIRCIFRVQSLVRQFKPDVMHSHMYHANIVARIARLIVRVPRLICTAHSNNEGGCLRMFAYRITNFIASITTNVSQGAVDAFERKGAVRRGHMLAIPNGIDTDKFSFKPEIRSCIRRAEGIGDEDKVILAVGRLVEAKNYPGLLVAFSIIYKNNKNLTLWIIGDGELMDELILLSQKLNIGDRVKFWGMRQDVELFYSSADVYVLSSAWEGFGLVVAEAMAAERVVVATDCGGVREVVGDQGILVAPGRPKDLAIAMESALKLDAADARSLGYRAKERIIANYSIETIVAKWLQLYQN